MATKEGIGGVRSNDGIDDNFDKLQPVPQSSQEKNEEGRNQTTSDIERWVEEVESKIQVHKTYPDGLGYHESWKGGRACTNCVVYRWTCDMKNPKKCSRCKMLIYCSRICQLEHYNKTHKSHCKYLAGLKVKEGSIHTKKNCPRCISTKRLSVEELQDPQSSIYPCPFGPGALFGEEKRNKLTGQKQMTVSIGGFLPFELGEITGKFNHPLEQCLSILAHMCMKLTYTTPSAYHQLWALAEKLSHMRRDAWNNWVHSVNMDIFPQTFRDTSEDLFNKLREICREHCPQKAMEGTDWWNTLSLYTEVTCDLATCILVGNIFKDECIASLQPILDLVTEKMPAYDDIIRAMCDQQVERVCEGCNKEMIVRAFCAQSKWTNVSKDMGVITSYNWTSRTEVQL